MIDIDVKNFPEWEIVQVDIKSNEWLWLISQYNHLVFHEPVWFEILEKGFNGKTCCLVFRKNSHIVGGMSGIIIGVLFIRFLYFNIPYGGIFGEVPENGMLNAFLKDFAKRKKICRIRIINSPGSEINKEFGLKKMIQDTFILDLRNLSFEQLWKGFKPAIRRDVRKAERNNIVIEEAKSIIDVKVFYSLYQQSMARNSSFAKYPFDFLKGIFETLISQKKGTILLARKDQDYIAGVLLLDSVHLCSYYMAGSKTDTLKYLPNDLLIHAAIKRAIENGFEMFDFMGTDGHDPALEHFKLKWGALRVPITIYDLETIPMLLRIWDFTNNMKRIKTMRTIFEWVRQSKK